MSGWVRADRGVGGTGGRRAADEIKDMGWGPTTGS